MAAFDVNVDFEFHKKGPKNSAQLFNKMFAERSKLRKLLKQIGLVTTDNLTQLSLVRLTHRLKQTYLFSLSL